MLVICLFLAFAFSCSATQVFSWGRNTYGQLDVPSSLTNATSISAGFEHCLALRSDGTVTAWGQNGNGQLDTPAAISNNVVAISAGRYHNLALLNDGSLVAWGAGLTNAGSGNDYGQSIIPADVTNILAFSAGGQFSLALLADGTVKAWGRNTSGQTNVPAGLSNVVAIAAGGFHGLALKADGTLAGWGGGNGSPGSIPAGLSNIIAIAATANNSYAIRSDGSLAVWGDNFARQLNIPSGISNVVTASGGAFYSVIAADSGVPRSWGDYDSTLPVDLTNHTVAVAGGFYMGLALTNDGSPVVTVQPPDRRIFSGNGTAMRALVAGEPPMAYQWSSNGVPIPDATNATLMFSSVQTNQAGLYRFIASNSLGIVASSNAVLTVVQQPPVLTAQAAGAVTYRYGPATFSASALGSLPMTYQWQLNGTNVANATNSTLAFSSVSPGQAGYYSLIVSNDFGVAVSSNANLIILAVRDNAYSVPLSLTNAVAIAAGTLNGMALKSDNSLFVWGDNTYKQTNVPPAATNLMAIAAGPRTCAIIRSNGTVLMWGDGYEFNGNSNKTNPPPIATNIVAVAVGEYHCLGLRKNGSVVAWGRGNEGQTNIPVSCTNIVAIAVGAYHSLALRGNGTLIAWGQNTSGQTNIPAGLTNIIAISAANNHNFVLKSDGTTAGWGAGVPQVPSSVAVATGWSSGSSYFPVIRADGTVNGSSFAGTSNTVALAACGSHQMVLIGDGTPFLYWPPSGFPAAYPGDNVTARIYVSGSGPIYYQWQLNGTNVSGATNALLTLNNIPITAAGSYRCIISNAQGTVISPETTLNMTRYPLLFSTANGATQMTGNGFQLHLTGLAGGGSAVIYASTNLLDWTPVYTNPPVVGTLDWLDPNATNLPSQYYRASEGQ